MSMQTQSLHVFATLCCCTSMMTNLVVLQPLVQENPDEPCEPYLAKASVTPLL